jgi:hypothetical protein
MLGCEWETREGGRPFNYLNRIEGLGYSTFDTLTCALFGDISFLGYRPVIAFDRSDFREKEGTTPNPLLDALKERLLVVLH